MLTDFMGENNKRQYYGDALVFLVISGVTINLIKFLIELTNKIIKLWH